MAFKLLFSSIFTLLWLHWIQVPEVGNSFSSRMCHRFDNIELQDLYSFVTLNSMVDKWLNVVSLVVSDQKPMGVGKTFTVFVDLHTAVIFNVTDHIPGHYIALESESSINLLRPRLELWFFANTIISSTHNNNNRKRPPHRNRFGDDDPSITTSKDFADLPPTGTSTGCQISEDPDQAAEPGGISHSNAQMATKTTSESSPANWKPRTPTANDGDAEGTNDVVGGRNHPPIPASSLSTSGGPQAPEYQGPSTDGGVDDDQVPNFGNNDDCEDDGTMAANVISGSSTADLDSDNHQHRSQWCTMSPDFGNGCSRKSSSLEVKFYFRHNSFLFQHTLGSLFRHILERPLRKSLRRLERILNELQAHQVF
ncbi:uncharacterized protein LOC129757567 [Uranotaenia lowii]|uniref:uncharacterized protein LOC129757567 n=1 Tax=Uranotaenia lowii TaxID=190385 RepID=UPI00247A7345|nr:uncharacterized protein LOC129757567 [Uranotaenia lowii]